MPERRKMTDAARQFLETGQVEPSPPIQKQESTTTKPSLKAEILGDKHEAEPSIRFTVDIPRSLNKRLVNLSQDSQKPKTELARTILARALDELGY